jgi:hypothetical protein
MERVHRFEKYYPSHDVPCVAERILLKIRQQHIKNCIIMINVRTCLIPPLKTDTCFAVVVYII